MTESSLRQELRPSGYAASSCRQCVLFDRCGGLFNDRPMMNCFEQFCCNDGACDHVCPYKRDDYQRRMLEIGGLRFDDIPPLHQSPMTLPAYVPMIHHPYRKRAELQAEAVALDPYLIFRIRSGSYSSVASDGASLRRHFKISPTTRIILRGTAEDRFLERYWSYRKTGNVIQQMASLGVSLVIGPNYSQFLDTPRTDSLFNRKRQLLCLAEISNAGISVAPHLSALMPPDWVFWTNFLKSNPQLIHVALNFQTGNKEWNEGVTVVDRVKKVQDAIGRPVTLILIGGAQFVQYAARQLGSVVLIDSEPFAKAHRRRLFHNVGEKRGWDETWTLTKQPIDHILQGNIDKYARWVELRSAKEVPSVN